MRSEHYIALDVHCAFTELAVVTKGGRLTKRERCPTAIPPLLEAISSVPRPRYVTFEEGPMADWLYRSLLPHADEVLVCEPRRNHLIAKESDKDDPIDAEKLAQLYRGGYLKRVHHPESLDRAVFKQHVGLYHDSVRERVRRANHVIAQFRRHGLLVKEAHFSAKEDRLRLVRSLPASALLRNDLTWLWGSYDAALAQEEQFEQELTRQARHIEPIRRFVRLPGILWIRASTFYVYLDTPWRFKGKSALWKYLGIGLERRHSGSGPVRLRVSNQANRRLKGMILGAARKAIDLADNPFALQYQRWINQGGLTVPNARRNVARSLAATLWAMWKNGSEYRPEWIGGARWSDPQQAQ
jgi:transposase